MNLQVDLRGAVCELRLASPPGNVIDRAFCADFESAVREHAENRDVGAFLLSSEGEHFSYGASVPEHRPGEMERFLPAFHGAVRALAATHVPVIAAVRGLCLGGGFELAAFAHIVIAERTASFGVPEIQLGVFPPLAAIVLPWKVAGAKADDWILSGRRIPASEAHEAGLVTRLAAAGDLEDAVEAYVVEVIAPRSASSLRFAARAARHGLNRDIEERLPGLETLYLEDLMKTADANEGINAFIEKRSPKWENR